MKKVLSLLLALLVVASLCAVPASAEELVYGTATLSYAEFYSGDVSSVEAIDGVTSATSKKAATFPNAATDFVDEKTNADGYHVTGVANVNVALAAADVEAYQALNPSFAPLDEAPAQYKPVSIENGEAVYGATVFNEAAVVSDAALELVTDSHWGDYMVSVIESSTAYLRNTRSDEGFAVGSGVYGAIIETESGLKVGMEHLASLWVQPYEISWNVSADNSHNEEITYDNLPELDKLMGEKITKITYINRDEVYVYTFDGVYVPIKFESAMTAENARSADGKTAVSVTGLVEDYAPAFRVEGLDVAVADMSEMTWTEDVAGSYTLLLEDENGKYAPLRADFVLSTELLPVVYDAELQELTLAEGASQEMFDAFLRNLSKVTVNGNEYNASGHGAVVIINKVGELDTEAAISSGRGADAVVTPIFAESGEYEITVQATGFDTALSFTAVIEK